MGWRRRGWRRGRRRGHRWWWWMRRAHARADASLAVVARVGVGARVEVESALLEVAPRGVVSARSRVDAHRRVTETDVQRRDLAGCGGRDRRRAHARAPQGVVDGWRRARSHSRRVRWRRRRRWWWGWRRNRWWRRQRWTAAETEAPLARVAIASVGASVEVEPVVFDVAPRRVIAGRAGVNQRCDRNQPPRNCSLVATMHRGDRRRACASGPHAVSRWRRGTVRWMWWWARDGWRRPRRRRWWAPLRAAAAAALLRERREGEDERRHSDCKW